ncbi:MAG: site-specific DNA-methyltransferase [Ruminococcaceae bacterium]|nr:site-specific DNA-methyltransferase [Oscillospiraceae bacterium]
MTKIKSDKNKTIDFTVEDGKKYIDRCVKVDSLTEDPSSFMNKTILGDTFDAMARLPQKFIDLAVADPPYNLTKEYHGNIFSKKNAADYEEYTRKWLSLVYPLLKDEGSIYVCCDWETSLIIGGVIGEFFNIRNRITWQREKGRGASANWKNGMEDIWFATKSKNYTFNLEAVKIRKKVIAPYKVNGDPKDWDETEQGNFRNTCPSNFWDDITIPFWSMPENTAHPTQKSEKLFAKIILASSNENDVVFDPFLGSGTTSVVAKKLGRRYVGVEMNEQYCAWAEKRLETAETEKTVQGYVNGVFWERNTLAEQNLVSGNKTANTENKQIAESEQLTLT